MTDQDASNSGRGAMTAREFCAPVLRAPIDVVSEDDYELKWRLHDALDVVRIRQPCAAGVLLGGTRRASFPGDIPAHTGVRRDRGPIR